MNTATENSACNNRKKGNKLHSNIDYLLVNTCLINFISTDLSRPISLYLTNISIDTNPYLTILQSE